MECGPDGCPIRIFSDLTPDEQRVERKRLAERLYIQGFTQEQIAKQLSVSKATISGDLSNCSTTEQLKPAKTESNPKGAGRPKGSTKPRAERHPKAVAREEKIATLSDAGLSAAEIGKEMGLCERAIHQSLEHVEIKREAQRDPIIDPATLSKTAQEKLASAMRQHQRKLDADYERRLREGIRAGIQKALEATVLPYYEEKLALYEQVTKARKGLMKKADFNKIRFCLHPDQYMNRTKEQRNAATQLWEKLEVVLVAEDEKPTTFDFKMPKTLAELMARKKAAQEKRKAKRSTNHLAAGAA
jgi:IS30 family transposase